jgi:hypothetical protein
MPDLCLLGDVKLWLGIPDSDNTSDANLSRLITSVSADFIGQIRRPSFMPGADHVERISISNWQPESRTQDIFLKHYPVTAVSSVNLNGSDLAEFDEDTPAIPGWLLDHELVELDPEASQKITLIGVFLANWGITRHHSIYRPPAAQLIVKYEAGYDVVPADVAAAVVEWVGFKKGFAELQAKDQTSQWLQIGQFQQNTSIATSTVKFAGVDMPGSVADVIDRYRRPVI